MGFKELTLRQNEKLLMSGSANKWETFGSKGGKLFLTDQRIVFQAHGFNFGSKFDEYQLSDIQTQGNTVNIKTTTNLISFNITFYTKYGEELSFVVTRSQKNEWIRQITEAVTSLARSRISFQYSGRGQGEYIGSNQSNSVSRVRCFCNYDRWECGKM